jgi:ZIP family zinc transporter
MCVPAAVALCGGVLATLWHPTRKSRSLIQHFAAGVVLAAFAVEVFPELERGHAPGWLLLVAFAVGAGLMFGLKLLSHRLEQSGHGDASGASALSIGLVLATFVDVAIDGLIIGAGFAAGGSTGVVLALGLSVELLFLGLSLASDKPAGLRMLGLSAGLAVVVLAAAAIGGLALAGASPTVISAGLAFGAAALLYLVTEELLVEAHTAPETPISTVVLFGGFLVFWCIQVFGVA